MFKNTYIQTNRKKINMKFTECREYYILSIYAILWVKNEMKHLLMQYIYSVRVQSRVKKI